MIAGGETLGAVRVAAPIPDPGRPFEVHHIGRDFDKGDSTCLGANAGLGRARHLSSVFMGTLGVRAECISNDPGQGHKSGELGDV